MKCTSALFSNKASRGISRHPGRSELHEVMPGVSHRSPASQQRPMADAQLECNLSSSGSCTHRALRPLRCTAAPAAVPATQNSVCHSIDQQRLLTLELLNAHTESIGVVGCSIRTAAAIPAGVQPAAWRQCIVELYASAKQLTVAEAQQQVEAILASPRDTPCFVACGPNPSGGPCKTVLGIVVGRLAPSPNGPGATRPQTQPSAEFGKQNCLQIDTLCVQGLDGLPPTLNRISCSSCGDMERCSCRASSIGRTLLLWLLGEAGCFDHTDAQVSPLVWDSSPSMQDMFLQLGFEPSRRLTDAGSKALYSPAGHTLSQDRARLEALYSGLGPSALYASAWGDQQTAYLSPARHKKAVAVCCAGNSGSKSTAAGALGSIGSSPSRRVSGQAAAYITASRISVVANANSVGLRGHLEQDHDWMAAEVELSALSAPECHSGSHSSWFAASARPGPLYRKAGLLTQLTQLPRTTY